MRRFRVKSFRKDYHRIQRRYFGLFWASPPDRDCGYVSLDNALDALEEYVRDSTGYPKTTGIITEDEILNAKPV